MEILIDALVVMQSRALRWIGGAFLLALIALEGWVLVTGTWPNIGSAPPGTGCRYWTGTKLLYRQDFDPANCPLHIEGLRAVVLLAPR